MTTNGPDATQHLIDTPEELADLIERLSHAEMVAIDIESNGYYNYFDRTCILTLSTPKLDAIVDSLALWDSMALFAPIFNDPNRLVLLHSGTYDIASLKRDFGLRFARVFDTLIAAQLLGREQLGLAGLVRDYLGIQLPKELQRYNWSERPLKSEHLAYVVGDTRHLFTLRDHLMAEIEAKDLIEELELDCVQLAELAPAAKPAPDEEGFRRIKGVREMSNTQRGVLRAIHLLRDEISAKLDIAPFRVIANGALVEMALRPPKDLAGLERIRGINARVRAEYGAAFVDAIERGQKEPQPLRRPRDPDAPQPAPRPTQEERDLERELKQWRRDQAEARGVGVQAILPTPVLQDFLRHPPQALAELTAHPRMGEHRSERYGAYLMEFSKRLSRS